MATFRLVTTSTVSNPNVHDLYLNDSGQLELIGDDITDGESYALALAQRVKCRLLLIRGEWYLDQRVGTPWKERLWVKGATAETLRRVIRDVVESTPGVLELVGMDITTDPSARTATVTNLVITTDTGRELTIAELDEPMIFEVPRG